MRKSKTKSAAMRRADMWFSRFVRLRDADKGGTCSCCACGRLMHWRGDGCHAGHFVRRGRQSTRYDERNVNAMCVRCNTFLDGAEWEHGRYIDAVRGGGTAAELKRKGEEIQKTSRAYFDEIAEKYRAKAIALGYGEAP